MATEAMSGWLLRKSTSEYPSACDLPSAAKARIQNRSGKLPKLAKGNQKLPPRADTTVRWTTGSFARWYSSANRAAKASVAS